MPYFSIVITVYNKAKFIEGTLNSVLNQSFQDFEIIIINDGSTDESLDKIESFNDKRIKLITTTNKGVSGARNTGIEAANANYIALLDGDDLWENNYLNEIKCAISVFSSNSVFSTAIAHKYQNRTTPATYNFKQEKKSSIRNFFESSLDHSILTSSSIVFKKDILRKIGYFDTSIKSGEDIDFWIRIGMNYDVVFINKVLAYYNYVSDSISNTMFSVKNKPKFDKFIEEEKSNKYLKIYIDRNRFPLAILSKLEKNEEGFRFYQSQINNNNLRVMQRIILHLPVWLLKLMLRLKSLHGKKMYYPVN